MFFWWCFVYYINIYLFVVDNTPIYHKMKVAVVVIIVLLGLSAANVVPAADIAALERGRC